VILKASAAEDLKNFIKKRTNEKLVELGYIDLGNYFPYVEGSAKKLDWFYHLTGGVTHTDFFAIRSTDYSKAMKAKTLKIYGNMWNEEWIKGVDYPEWGDTEVYKKTIAGGYLLAEGESPKDAYERVAKTVARRLYKPELAKVFFDYIWKGWLNLASPVLSNTGTDRGLPISCFGIDVADSIQDIGAKNLEMMMLAKHGGGVGVGINMIRPAGAKITGNGTSDGVVPFCKIYDSTILATNQGAVRRGAASVNINIDHPDFEEWLEIREPKGDVNRQSLNLHQCAVVGDKFMRRA
jgi:ribonucleoside-diphosphate reductase alpha chain